MAATGGLLLRSLSRELAPYQPPGNAIAPKHLGSGTHYPRALCVDDPAAAPSLRRWSAGRPARPPEIGERVRYPATTQVSVMTGAIIGRCGSWPAAPARRV